MSLLQGLLLVPHCMSVLAARHVMLWILMK
jgi:hypothetical protein